MVVSFRWKLLTGDKPTRKKTPGLGRALTALVVFVIGNDQPLSLRS